MEVSYFTLLTLHKHLRTFPFCDDDVEPSRPGNLPLIACAMFTKPYEVLNSA